MNDLGPDLRSMLEAARGAESPTRADRARIKHAVLLRVATVGAASAVSTAAGSAIAMPLATKVTVAALAVAVVGGGGPCGLGRARGAAGGTTPCGAIPGRARDLAWASNPAGAAARSSGCRATTAPQTAAARGAASRSGPQRGTSWRKRRARRDRERTLRQAPALDSLDPELTVLRQAQEDLRAGPSRPALRRLAEYDRRFGKGTLNEERRAIGAIALCQAHPGPAAQAQAERFLRTAPQSPLAGRVRSACQKSDESGKTVRRNWAEPGTVEA